MTTVSDREGSAEALRHPKTLQLKPHYLHRMRHGL